MIGQGHGRHALPLRLVHQFGDRARAVEQGIVGVNVKMNKTIHGLAAVSPSGRRGGLTDYS
ncbi:MAG: hypothetical protein ACRD1L_06940, partial [Terriglobales bacterium]